MFLHPALHPQVGDFMYVRHGALGATCGAPIPAAAGDAAVTYGPSDAAAVAANGNGVLSGREVAASGFDSDGSLADGDDETEESMGEEAGEEEEGEDEDGAISESDGTFTGARAGLDGKADTIGARSRRSSKHKVSCGHMDTVPPYREEFSRVLRNGTAFLSCGWRAGCASGAGACTVQHVNAWGS